MGRPGETTVMCFHGLGSSPRAFEAIATSSAVKVYAFERPCFSGFGSRAQETVSDKPLTDAISEIRRDILDRDLRGLVLLGHSMGGIVALRVAEFVPERVAAIVSIEGNLIAEDCGLMSRDLANCQTLEDVEIHRARLLEFASRSQSVGLKAWIDDFQLVAPHALQNYARQTVEESASGELLSIFKRLYCRRLYVYGDSYRDHPVLDKLEGIPKRHLPNAGHFVMQDEPEAFERVVSELLESL